MHGRIRELQQKAERYPLASCDAREHVRNILECCRWKGCLLLSGRANHLAC